MSIFLCPTDKSSVLLLGAASSLIALVTVTGAALAQQASGTLPEITVQDGGPQSASAVEDLAGDEQDASPAALAHEGEPNQSYPGPNLTTTGSSGSRLGLTPLETPASVSIISGETARERGQHSVVDAVTWNAPGISSVSPPVFGSAFAARGFQGNNSVMQLYDGTRLFPGRGNITFPFNTWSVERIEVLHGPASVLYGEGAIGGIINVIPKKPITTGSFNEAQVFFDSNMTRRASLDSGGAITNALSYRFNVSADASDGWIDRGDSKNLGISGAVRLQATSDLVFTLSHDYGDQEPMAYFGTPLRDGALVPGTRKRNYNVRDNILEFRDTWTQFKTEWTPSENLSFRNVAYHLDSRREFMNADTPIWNTSTNLVDLYGSHIRQKQDQIGNRFDATVRTNLMGANNETVLGFDVNRGRFGYATYFWDYDPIFGPIFGNPPIASVDPFNPQPVNFPTHTLQPRFNSELHQTSFFAENRLVVNEYLSLVGGVRWDDLELERNAANPAQSFSRSFNAFNWRAGAVVTPLPGLAFFGQYSVATDPLNVPLLDLEAVNQDFDLTRGRMAEIGVKQSLWNGAFEWSLSAYHIVKTDLLVATSLTQRLQVGEQSSRGLEATIGAELGGGWRVDANGALIDAEYNEFGAATIDPATFSIVALDFSGNRPFLIPEKLANVWLSWAFAPNWEASIGMQYVGSSFANPANTIKQPSYTVTNVGLQWQPTPSATLDFRVKNVFDKEYAQYLSVADPLADVTDVKAYIAPPRTFETSLSVRF